MKRLDLWRKAEFPDGQGTPGKLTGEGFACDTLELPWNGNEHNRSCIPPGVYRARWVKTGHHPNGVYMLQDVPGRAAIELHKGNWAGDPTPGWRSDVQGCGLLGRNYAVMVPSPHGPDIPGVQNARGKGPQAAILNSGPIVDEFNAWGGGEDLEIEVHADA